MHNSNYYLKFVLPAMARFEKGGVVDGAWLDGSSSHNMILK